MTEREILHDLAHMKAKSQCIGVEKWCAEHGLNSGIIHPSAEGKRGMTLGTLYEWCEALGVEPWRIVYAATRGERQ